MKLTHVGISSFRSIGKEVVEIDLTTKINVLVGANNCGKSNVLRALAMFGKKTEDELELHHRAKESRPSFYMTALSDDNDHDLLRSQKTIRLGWQQFGTGERILIHPFDNVPWRVFEPFWLLYLQPNWRFAGDPTRDQARDEVINVSLRCWENLKVQLPAVTIIPQFRQIVDGEDYDVCGTGVVRLLARWQHPRIGEEANLIRFQKIVSLVNDLTQLPTAHLEVNTENRILISNEGLRLPLESYGTGIHELIILAIAVLSQDNALVCIEEPEIHLHPLLQRRFLDFLRKETSNRYVITTHSPALIAPSDEIYVTHLWLENGVTKSRRIETTGHSLEALRDLGAKASDLLQANSVIWVEGPSDRIYLRRWLELLRPGEFREGIDYAIMFYGGRLLAHVGLERELPVSPIDAEDVDDLVHLLRINQHSAILIDSDRRKAADELNATKKRVQQECANSSIPCWVTDGREIENYLSTEALEAAYAEMASVQPELKFECFASLEESLEKAFAKKWKRASYYDHAKPQCARAIAKHTKREHLTPELTSWVEKVACVIRHEPLTG